MAGRRLITDELAEQVKEQLDESTAESIDLERDVLPALNRAQDHASSILCRHYIAPLLAYTEVATSGSTAEIDLPEDALEERLEKVEVRIGASYYPLSRIEYRDITAYESSAKTSTPEFYCVVGNKFRLLPAPTGTYPLRVWYAKDPEPLVFSQGRITIINTGSNYLVVDSAGSDLTTSMDQLDSYVNLVDGETGVIKATMQVQNIANNKLTFKSSPVRTTVLGKTVVGTIPSTLGADDYVCLVHGNCIPFMKKPLSNFLVQYAVAELTRKLGGDAQLEENVLRKFEEQIQRTWAGREASLRVTKTSPRWHRFGRRIIIPTQG